MEWVIENIEFVALVLSAALNLIQGPATAKWLRRAKYAILAAEDGQFTAQEIRQILLGDPDKKREVKTKTGN